MMDEKVTVEERVAKVNQFTQQLINSGYEWNQAGEIIVSALKGMKKQEKIEESTEREVSN